MGSVTKELVLKSAQSPGVRVGVKFSCNSLIKFVLLLFHMTLLVQL